MPVLPSDDFGARIQALRPGTSQALAVGAVSHGSNPFAAGTTVVRAAASVPCFLAFGATPVAAADGHYLPAGAPEYFRVVPGEAVAVIRAVADGTLYLSEME